MLKFLKDKKNLMIILLAILFLIKIPKEGLRFAFWVSGGVLFCFCFDFLINEFFLKKRIYLNSAIITGFILSGILDYRQPWYVLVLFSAIATASKHLVKFHKKHIFNPANFALFLAGFFRLPLTWSIESSIPLIIICGIYFAYIYKKFPHILGFLVSFSTLFLISRANPIGMISWFFVFIMLIEPKTSGLGMRRGLIFGAIAGTVSFLIFRYISGFDVFVCALFAANLCNPLLEKIKD